MTTTSCDPDFEFVNEKDASRYTLTHRGDLVSVLDYRDDGHTVALTRAFTIPTFRGKGYAAVVTERAVAEIESLADRKIDPVCWYVSDWFEANPGKKNLLRRR